MRVRFGTWLFALTLAWAAFPSDVEAQDRRVSPQVFRALETGVLSPMSLKKGIKPGMAPVVLELTSPPTPAILTELESRGARLRFVEGSPVIYDRFVPAFIDAASMDSLLQSNLLRRIRNTPIANHLRPLDHSANLIGLDAARGSRPALDLLTGKNILIADLDSNADIFHPQFFHADAGWFDWIDVNGDGVFTPGIDAIDVDRDGQAGSKETAQWLKSRTLNLYYGDEVKARPTTFDPGIDWIYLDDNGNGKRDFGAAAGFDDSAPAFGEPLFVPDDVNQNGILDVGERLVRLGTSKFSKVYVHIEYWADIDRVFQRGVDLSSLEVDYTGGISGYSDAMHGTAVLSIVAGDVPLVGRRWVGMAPEADLLLGFELAQDSAKALTWALNEKPNVMLHEVASWTGDPLDGSDTYSTMVDVSTVKDGMTHTCPTGNLGGSRKHARISLPASSAQAAGLEVPAIGATYMQVSLNLQGTSNAGISLREPGGQQHTITGGSSQFSLSTGAQVAVSSETTSRGTRFWDLLMWGWGNVKLPTGSWQVNFANQGTSSLTVDAYVMDEVSGWSEGVAWAHSIATDASTAGIPSVSDECIAVGAHTGHPPTPSTPWFNMPGEADTVRYYSGRGPRIDGVQKPDVVAPDNPWSAAPHGLDYMGNLVPHGSVWPFGGTSGAAPHVTGVAGLLAQAGIQGPSAREAVRSGAVHDTITGAVPNTDYGWGRLNAAQSLGVTPSGQAPVIALSASPASPSAGQATTLEVEVQDPGGPPNELEAKWDDGYDGTWETPYGPVAPRTVTYDEAGQYPIKVRVRNGQGRLGEAVVWVNVKEGTVDPNDAGPEASVDATADVAIDAKEDAPSMDAMADAHLDGGVDATMDSHLPEEVVGSGGGGGCGCRTAGGSSQRTAGGLLLTVLVGLSMRRRARGYFC